MNILQNNPYRLLGVYSNSPTKERLANHNRMKAFLKVGKPVSFPLDVPQYLSSINRTEASVTDAEAKLTLPKEQMLYAQFWFVKTTPLDDVAFKHLIAGEIDKAEEIWQKKECASSLQNRIVCTLMCGKYAEAMSFAETLYSNTQYVDQLITDIGTGVTLDTSNLVFSFLDALCDEIGADKLLTFISNAAWKDYIKGKTVKPIIEHIQDAIDIGQKSKDKGAIARYEAGKFLIEDTKQLVLQLRNLLSPSEIQYQTIVDKLGLEILQCGIDYYNDSEEPDAAKKAMVLQSYAKSIVAGQMAKERCKENVDILQKTIDNLPPLEVFAEDCAIRKELRRYCSLPDEISYAIELLNNTKPLLQTIKEKLGKGNEYYLKMSTLVVSNALSNIIGEVNSSQDNNVLLRAWEAFKVMNSFDMESSFYNERYLKNYTTLRDLCKKQEIHEMKYKDGWVIICSIIIIEIIYLWLGYEEIMKGFLISLAGWFLFPINVILVLMVDAICKSIYRFYFYKSSATYKPVSLRKKIENAVEKEDIKKIGKKPKQNPITWAKKNPTCMVGIIFTAACTFLGGDINGGEGAFYGFFIAIGIIGGIASLLEDEL